MTPPDAGAVAAPEIVIGPPERWRPVDLRELWAHRELIYFLTKRELQIRYKQSVFGVSWALLQPLVFAFILALFFGLVAKVPTPSGLPYAVFAVVGIVPWLFTANAIQQGAGSLVLDANLIAKVYFPRLALPISKALSLMIDLGIALIVVIAVVLIYGVAIAPTVWLVPAFLALGVVTAFSIATFLAAVNVKYRDVQLVVPMLTQVLFFASPVIYAGTLVGDTSGHAWSYIYSINPMASVLDGMRWALIEGQPYPGTVNILISVCSALILLVGALLYFRRAEDFFADVI
jgi:lipopolysaccharide transport system permease protein